MTTSAYLLTQRAVDDLVERAAIGLVYGGAGRGKTFAVAAAAERQPVDCCWFDFPGRTTTKALAKALLERLSGVPQSGTRSQLEERLMDALAERIRLIIIDEAQRLYAEAIEYLRHLWDRPQTRFALLLVGGDGCWRVISRYPMVRSRLYRSVHFDRLTGEEILEHIPRFHPIYEGADPKLLTEIDDQWGDGTLRNWASFTATAEKLMTENRVGLSREVVDNALDQLGDLERAALARRWAPPRRSPPARSMIGSPRWS